MDKQTESAIERLKHWLEAGDKVDPPTAYDITIILNYIFTLEKELDDLTGSYWKVVRESSILEQELHKMQKTYCQAMALKG